MNTITQEQAEAMFCDFIDSAGLVLIAGIPFNRSTILRKLDPVAYRTGMNDYLDGVGYEVSE